MQTLKTIEEIGEADIGQWSDTKLYNVKYTNLHKSKANCQHTQTNDISFFVGEIENNATGKTTMMKVTIKVKKVRLF